MQPTQPQPIIGNLQPTNRTFKKSQLLIVVAVVAVLGILTLVLSNALTPANGDFEAETMTVEAL